MGQGILVDKCGSSRRGAATVASYLILGHSTGAGGGEDKDMGPGGGCKRLCQYLSVLQVVLKSMLTGWMVAVNL